MKSSAEQLHHQAFNAQPNESQDVRLYIDLDVCSTQCSNCTIQCSYYDLTANNGIHSIIELATYALVCRRCDNPHCIKSCPVNALEQQQDKGSMLVRHTMRCISCQSCSHACPYGTIYPDYVPLLAHNCDFCFDRRDNEDEPLCIKTCAHSALRLQPADSELDADTFLVGDHLIVHSTHWQRDKA